MNTVLVINPGSTSTKIAIYRDGQQQWKDSVEHSAEELRQFGEIFEQLPMRIECVLRVLNSHDEELKELDAVAARGGLLPSVVSGTYEVTENMVDALRRHTLHEHASNLGGAIAYDIARRCGARAFIVDPVTVDEMCDVARITGIKEIRRFGQGHNLNMRAAAINWCRQNDRDYYHSNIIVAHMGGGTTLSLHACGRIEDMVSDDEGPFSPERAGALPVYRLLTYIHERWPEGTFDTRRFQKILHDEGGLYSWFKTKDVREVITMADEGNEEAKLVLEAMVLGIAKSIAQLSVVVDGHIDAIVLTGGIAFSEYITGMIRQRVEFIAPVSVIPGENEMQALSDGAERVLSGKETARIYFG